MFKADCQETSQKLVSLMADVGNASRTLQCRRAKEEGMSQGRPGAVNFLTLFIRAYGCRLLYPAWNSLTFNTVAALSAHLQGTSGRCNAAQIKPTAQ